MKVLKKEQIIKLEAECMNFNRLNSIILIEMAASSFVTQFIDIVHNTNNTILILCGNGKNGADGLQIANLLVRRGYNVEVGIIYVAKENSEEFSFYLNNMYDSIPKFSIELQDLSSFTIPYHDYLIDGIFGIGLNRDLPKDLANFIIKLNDYASYKIAIDIPTGILCDGSGHSVALICNETIAIGSYKPCYFLCESLDYVGYLRLAEIEIFKSFIDETDSDVNYLDKSFVKNILKPVKRIVHKYQLGHSLIVGGGHGIAGCMKLSGEAALRSGCGLVTLHVPYASVDFLQASFPEAMIDVDDNKYHIGPFDLAKKVSAIGIGPGMGLKVRQFELLVNLFNQTEEIPVVIDADAISLLSKEENWEDFLPNNFIMTPHKGEFDRLFKDMTDQSARIECMKKFSLKHQAVIILKGADTVISTPEGAAYFSNYGNSGMATAGSGDVLTGILTSLLAQGYSLKESALLGVYLHGTAGDHAAKSKGERSMIASDIIENIGNAYNSLNF